MCYNSQTIKASSKPKKAACSVHFHENSAGKTIFIRLTPAVYIYVVVVIIIIIIMQSGKFTITVTVYVPPELFNK